MAGKTTTNSLTASGNTSLPRCWDGFLLIISMLFGGRAIRFLRNLQIGEDIRRPRFEGQTEKGTPTMGVIIIMGIVIPVLLVADLSNIYILVMFLVTTWMAIIGFTDDYTCFKRQKRSSKGAKIVGQVGCGLPLLLR
ncbi:MAG: hypothetical protein R2788_14800 [Saprospiraceae bacterium]